MFPGPQSGTFSFTKIREALASEKDELLAHAAKAEKKDDKHTVEDDDEEEGDEGDEEDEDTEMKDDTTPGTNGGGLAPPKKDAGSVTPGGQGQGVTPTPQPMEVDGELAEGMWVEDEEDQDGAVWFMRKGRIVEWNAFFAMLFVPPTCGEEGQFADSYRNYIYDTINPTIGTPVLLVHPPSFTQDDKERVTQFFFEKLKVPGLSLLDSSIAAMWAYGAQTAAVIDVGHEKTDITPIVDFMIQERSKATIMIGGEDMTKHLASLLPDLKYEDVETLKRSDICEILPPGVPIPGSSESEIQAPRNINITNLLGTTSADDDTVMSGESLDVAKIVMDESKLEKFVEKKPGKVKGQKGKEKEAEAKAAAELAEKAKPNRERFENKFWVVDKKRPGEDEEEAQQQQQQGQSGSAMTSPITAEAPPFPPAPVIADPAVSAPAEPAPALITEAAPMPTDAAPADPAVSIPPSAPAEPQPAPTSSTLTSPTTATGPGLPAPAAAAPKKATASQKIAKKAADLGITLKHDETLRQLTVGPERFHAADCGIIDAIASATHASLNSVEEVGKRSELWDNLIIVGNGGKVKGLCPRVMRRGGWNADKEIGFKETLLYTLISRYQISQSSGTMFTNNSELPTPSATPGSASPYPGSSTPQRPLLHTATSNLHAQYQPNPYIPPGSIGAYGSAPPYGHHQSGQTPMSVKAAKMPEYFPEWKGVGYEEAAWLGAQVAAKVVFVVDQGNGKGWLGRGEYNELGPGGIMEVGV